MNICTKICSLATTVVLLVSLLHGSPALAQCAGLACTVQTTADTTGGGQTSLRDAIGHANANPGTAITFSNGIANGTITLTSELPLILGNNTTIDGGANNITVSGNNTVRGFFVGNTTSAVSATIRNLTIANASARGGNGGSGGGGGGAGLGGAVFVSANATLAMSDVALAGNSAVGGASTGAGGGQYRRRRRDGRGCRFGVGERWWRLRHVGYRWRQWRG